MKKALLALTLCMPLVVLAASPSESAVTAAQRLQSIDLFELEWATDPQLSPDGKQLIYIRNSNDIMTDSSRGSIWLIDVASGEQRPLLSGKANYSQARWSPDGKKIAFVSDQSGTAQIHLLWLATGKEAQLSKLTQSPTGLVWSPDGSQLAFRMNVMAGPTALARSVKLPAKPKDAKWAEAPVLIERAQYQADGQGFLKSAYRQVFVLPAEGGSARQLTFGDFNHGDDMIFSPDGQSVVFSANLATDWEYQPKDADLYRLSLSDGRLTQLTSQAGQESSPVFSPDGQRLAYIWASNAKVPFTNGKLQILQLATGQSSQVAPRLDLDLSAPDWLNNQELTVQYDEQGLRKVGRISEQGKLTPLLDSLSGTTIPQPYLSGSYQLGQGMIAFTRGDAHRPADIALWQQGKVRQLTRLNDDLLAHKQLGQVHELRYKSSFDGEDIQGWYITPPDFDPAKKYPLVVEIHGGPHLAYGPHFSAEMQRLAAEGYVVFYDNHRGSTSYGERFTMLLHNKYSSPEDYADHDSGVNALIEKGFIDKEHLYISGGSAGGIATAYAIGLTDRYRAAAVFKPVINWTSKVLTGDTYLYQTFFQFPGVPWEHLEHYWQRSPIARVGHIKTPTLIMTGESDRRTPISESEQLYQALKIQKVPAALVRLPGAPHGIANKPSRMISKIEYTLAWFRQYQQQ